MQWVGRLGLHNGGTRWTGFRKRRAGLTMKKCLMEWPGLLDKQTWTTEVLVSKPPSLFHPMFHLYVQKTEQYTTVHLSGFEIYQLSLDVDLFHVFVLENSRATFNIIMMGVLRLINTVYSFLKRVLLSMDR